jgi:hypothetical protein
MSWGITKAVPTRLNCCAKFDNPISHAYNAKVLPAERAQSCELKGWKFDEVLPYSVSDI